MSDLVSPEERTACQDLLIQEAALLDSRRFAEWLALFTKDIRYWVPLHEGQTDPDNELNIIYDDLNRLDDRVYRIEAGFSVAQDPPSRTARVVSNFQVETGPTADLWLVRSTYMLFEVRPGSQTILGGHYTHHLRSTEAGLRIAFKRIDLMNSEEPLSNLTFLL